MSHGHIRQQWNYWSQLLCLIANCNRNAEKHPAAFVIEDFHPYLEKKTPDQEPNGFDDYSTGMIETAKYNRFRRYGLAG